MNAPLDALHEECLLARHHVRQSFAQARTAASEWAPAACPPAPSTVRRPGADRQRIPYADEVLPPRPWLR